MNLDQTISIQQQNSDKSQIQIKNSFQEILHLIDNWINERSGWIFESFESQYINISTYRPLSGSSYVKLPSELRSPRKGLINIKNKYQKYFLWCNVMHINPVRIHRERIKKEDKDLQGKDFDKIEVKNNIYLFSYENGLTFSIFVSKVIFENFTDLLHVIDGD